MALLQHLPVPPTHSDMHPQESSVTEIPRDGIQTRTMANKLPIKDRAGDAIPVARKPVRNEQKMWGSSTWIENVNLPGNAPGFPWLFEAAPPLHTIAMQRVSYGPTAPPTVNPTAPHEQALNDIRKPKDGSKLIMKNTNLIKSRAALEQL
eukprot:3249764-Amphidinium_carterae.1